MRRARQPLSEAHDVFEPGFLGGDGERDRALNHVGIKRRTIVGALNVLQRVGDALDIATHWYREAASVVLYGTDCQDRP